MKSLKVDIAIIGGGCVGSSIFYTLRRFGLNNIALIDCGRKTLSATAHSGGMLRVFHEQKEHVQLALENRKLLNKYQQEKIINQKEKENGSLYFFHKNRYPGYKNNLKHMRSARYPFEVFNSSCGEKRFPQYNWEDVWAIYEPAGGQLSTMHFIDDLLQAGVCKNNIILDNCEITRICSYQNDYVVFSKDYVITANKLVLAGGARLLPRFQDLYLNLPLTVKPLTACVVEKTEKNHRVPNYFDRESLDFSCFSDEEKAILSKPICPRMKQQLWGKVIEKKSAYDVYTYNRLGLLGGVSGFSNLFIATGWGGTAFKFALAIGSRMAQVILESKR